MVRGDTLLAAIVPAASIGIVALAACPAQLPKWFALAVAFRETHDGFLRPSYEPPLRTSSVSVTFCEVCRLLDDRLGNITEDLIQSPHYEGLHQFTVTIGPVFRQHANSPFGQRLTQFNNSQAIGH
jgi:hypothetical protein